MTPHLETPSSMPRRPNARIRSSAPVAIPLLAGAAAILGYVLPRPFPGALLLIC
jgi:hypothetical protein